MEKCDIIQDIPYNDRKWYWFLLWSVLVFGVGTVLIIIGRLVSYALVRRKPDEEATEATESNESESYEYQELERGWYIELKETLI